MTIKEKNFKLLNDLENQLREYAIWIAKNGSTETSKTIEQYRDLRKFIISLSAAMIGIVFPLLLVSEILKENKFFIYSFIIFSIIIIYGIFSLVHTTINDLIGIPRKINDQLNELSEQIEQIEKIKKEQDNNLAGKKFLELKKKYGEELSGKSLNFFQKIWKKYEWIMFFGIFILGYIFLIAGFLNKF
ncbi:MAG: hypothetical protein PHU32_04085 [Candidatus ainarchaeum sp.]|nr:hypothetical protein [Candidatus ainarchaeum sp.]